MSSAVLFYMFGDMSYSDELFIVGLLSSLRMLARLLTAASLEVDISRSEACCLLGDSEDESAGLNLGCFWLRGCLPPQLG